MKKLNLLLAAALGCSLAGLAAAQSAAPASAPGTNTPRVDQRQANQAKRIDQGVASGELNQREARRLKKREAAIAQGEEKAKADGTVTAKERARLEHAQDKTSRRIAKQKHDAQQAKP